MRRLLLFCILNFLLFVTVIVAFAAPWYVLAGVIVSVFIFKTVPFFSPVKFLLDVLFWPIKIIFWIFR